MWEFTRGQNHIEKLSTTVTIVKQLGCTGKENVKTAGSHEMHTCDNCQRIAQIVTISKNPHRTTPQE